MTENSCGMGTERAAVPRRQTIARGSEETATFGYTKGNAFPEPVIAGMSELHDTSPSRQLGLHMAAQVGEEGDFVFDDDSDAGDPLAESSNSPAIAMETEGCPAEIVFSELASVNSIAVRPTMIDTTATKASTARDTRRGLFDRRTIELAAWPTVTSDLLSRSDLIYTPAPWDKVQDAVHRMESTYYSQP
jgi:hypothetical protein